MPLKFFMLFLTFLVAEGSYVTQNALAQTTPTLSSISASSTSGGTSGVVTWTTNEPATSKVTYGVNTFYGASTTADPTLVSNHSVQLFGLSPNTTYHFFVESSNASGTTATSSDQTLLTLGTSTATSTGTTTATTTATSTENNSGTTTPVFSNISASSTSDGTSGVVTWTTDQPTTSEIIYGVNTFYGAATTPDNTLLTNHSMTLFGLTPGTMYHYFIQSSNASGTVATTSDQTFMTLGTSTATTTPAPVLSNVNATSTSDGVGGTITWTTDQPATSEVLYGLNTFYGASTILNTSLVTEHSVTVSNLIAGTTYHFQVMSTNASGTVATSSDQSFATLSGTGTPAIYSLAVVSTGDGTGATVTWSTATTSNSQVLYGTTSTYTASTTPSVDSALNHSVTLSGLTPNTTYHFQVVSSDASSTTVTSLDQVFVTMITQATTTQAATASPIKKSSGGSSGGHRRNIVGIYPLASGASMGFVFTKNLYRGISNSDVITLQDILRALGYFRYPVSTGYFGVITFESVRAFQYAHKIPTTGYFGPLTREAISK